MLALVKGLVDGLRGGGFGEVGFWVDVEAVYGDVGACKGEGFCYVLGLGLACWPLHG